MDTVVDKDKQMQSEGLVLMSAPTTNSRLKRILYEHAVF